MYIRADNGGRIQLISVVDIADCLQYTGVIPDDFYATLGTDKYLFINGELQAVEGWVMPVFTIPTAL